MNGKENITTVNIEARFSNSAPKTFIKTFLATSSKRRYITGIISEIRITILNLLLTLVISFVSFSFDISGKTISRLAPTS